MPSTHKTFMPGEVLSAADVNNALNPDTADHVAYAVAAGGFSAGQKSGVSYTHRVTFPAGRFTVAPIVVATIANSAGGTQLLQLVVTAATKDYADLVFFLTTGSMSNHWCTANWTAVQMTPTTAEG